MLNRWIEKRFELPKIDVPDLRHVGDPEAAADALRRLWGIGEMPIRNMVHLLESRGVRLFSLSIESKEVDAFSMWSADTPIIMLNNFKSAERSRFDAAHELGHLVLHRHGAKNSNRLLEAQADAFASAFLMPSRSMKACAPKFATINSLISLKRDWGVSLAALNVRLHKVEAISEWHYKSLCMDIGKRGFRTQEPDEANRESSAVLQAILRDLYQNDGLSKGDIAKELSVPVDEIDALLFGLTLHGIQGNRQGPAPQPMNVGLTRIK